jgi:Fe-Mn family superoxide dismutase
MKKSTKANQTQFPFILPVLPYENTDLEPFMSAETFSYHHQKHHAAYVNNLNKLLHDSGNSLDNLDLEDIILSSHKKEAQIFNNAAQVWNHTFFWHSMKKNGGGSPSAKLLQMIERDFESLENFYAEFKKAAISQFGSGWVWLVLDGENLKIEKTSNAETPVTTSQKPLICCDVWEHAYYIDYQNRRPDFVEIFLNKLVNWDFADENLKN